jgi:uncharacterized protein (DUF488 family)
LAVKSGTEAAMLNRQKILLHLLMAAGRPVARLELMKWAFILRQECPSRGGGSFYDFLPYRFGPYSFCLTREIESLTRDGYVLEGHNTWELGPHEIGLGDPEAHRDAARLVNRFKDRPLVNLIDYVYEQHPRFTVNSERRKLSERAVADPAVYTAGYEGLSVDAFLDRLVEAGIQRVIDVRSNPIARRYGFHKSTLSSLAGRIDIDYVHIPELGIRSEDRRNLSDEASYRSLFASYRHTTLRQQSAAIRRTADLVAEKASVLVCMEADPDFCHRSHLAAEVAVLTGLKIHDLGHCQCTHSSSEPVF